MTALGQWLKRQRNWSREDETALLVNNMTYKAVYKYAVQQRCPTSARPPGLPKVQTHYLAQDMLTLAQRHPSITQTFVCNIGGGAQSVMCSETLPCPQLWTNADEANMRLRLHCAHSAGTKKLIFSPDTDVYHVGLTIAPWLSGTEIVVQLTKTFGEGSKFLLLHH